MRTPKESPAAVDLASPLTEIKTDCAIAQAVRDHGPGGTDNTPPFRYRRWLFAQTGLDSQLLTDEVGPRLTEHVPEYLRRNIRGRTPAELMFHIFLARLHDGGHIDDPNLPPAVTRNALAATLKLVRAELARAGKADAVLGNIAVTNGRSMAVAHLHEPLRLRRLSVPAERGERDESFRGFLLVSGGDGDVKEGFEDVPAQRAVLISRDLQISFAGLEP
ncbi:MAG TPA: hypothetical protein VGC42_25565 [Kofleriaceae bacterium]